MQIATPEVVLVGIPTSEEEALAYLKLVFKKTSIQKYCLLQPDKRQ